MSPLDGLWHLLNFVAPALATSGVASFLAKGVWRRRLRTLGLARLWAGAATSSFVCYAAAVILLGRDGKMAAYAALVTGCALSLWWAARGTRAA
jgi:hypothetical protein